MLVTINYEWFLIGLKCIAKGAKTINKKVVNCCTNSLWYWLAVDLFRTASTPFRLLKPIFNTFLFSKL